MFVEDLGGSDGDGGTHVSRLSVWRCSCAWKMVEVRSCLCHLMVETVFPLALMSSI